MARVLVVGDDESTRSLLCRLVAGQGHPVETAADGAEALERLKDREYDLLIIDFRLPRASGLDAISIIRSCSRLRKTRILAFTALESARAADEKIKDALAHGFGDGILGSVA